MTDITGKTFFRWTVLSRAERRKATPDVWNCICSCGIAKVVLGRSLRSGKSLSCGCLQREVAAREKTKHGSAWKTREYAVWQAMIQRCTNESHVNFRHYGGRGITVCEKWRFSYKAFMDDMGSRPSSKHTLERIDNNLGYFPSNCCWDTRDKQSNNTRWNRVLEFQGRSMTVSNWSKETGIKANTIVTRLRAGWSVERALAEATNTKFRAQPKKPGTGISIEELKAEGEREAA